MSLPQHPRVAHPPKGGVFRDVFDRELLHQPSHPASGVLQPSSPAIIAVAHVGESGNYRNRKEKAFVEICT